ncbi:MAG: hypothetical protein R3253_07740 [Longimicrobiales bacterium]|nr:hypothetical protein [Longimicrobiales bacterium]
MEIVGELEQSLEPEAGASELETGGSASGAGGSDPVAEGMGLSRNGSASPGTGPRPPGSLAEAGLTEELVAGLVLKALNLRGATLGFDLVELLALPMGILDEVIAGLQERRYVEVHETRGPRRGEYVFKLTRAGRTAAREEMEACRYVGPAPVPFAEYVEWVERQSVESVKVSRDDLRRALADVVIPEAVLHQIGPAANSGRSLFLHGGPGDGKTLLAERIAALFGERYYVPFTVLVDGSIMIVYDPVHHGPGGADGESSKGSHADRPRLADGDDVGPGEAPPNRMNAGIRDAILRAPTTHDPRYVEARRPVVMTGGELTLSHLDLQWDPSGRMYQAPPQLKAAGGVLVIDDLGRQRVPVQELLNRWVVPLEQGKDYLTPRSGRKIVVPFDCFVIFSTNLEPRNLTDEAFLRRIRYKVELPGPSRAELERIFRESCEARGVAFEPGAVTYLYDEIYADGSVTPRRCHPRDVLDHLDDLAHYRGEPLRLSPELLEQACRSCFLSAGPDSTMES